MILSELNESEQLALQAELARPLVHESNNFLNNLFLHMALFQEYLPAQLRADLETVRQEGKNLVNLLRQWQGSHRFRGDSHGKIELNEMIREIVGRLEVKEGPARFSLFLSDEPLWLEGPTGEFKRFCHLWLQNALSIKDSCSGMRAHPLVIETGKANDRIRLRVLNVSGETTWEGKPIFDEDAAGLPESLTMAACKSMARHLHGSIRMENGLEGQCNLVVEFP